MTDPAIEHLRRALAQPLPHPDDETLQRLSQATLAYVLQHWQTLPEQRIGRSATRPELEARLREPLPEEGMDFAAILQQFDEHVAAHAMRVNHPRFFAFIPSAPSFVSVLGDWLCAGTNFFAGVWLEAAGPAQVELLVLDWFKEILGYPPEASGILTSGGSEANLTALVVAREHLSYADRAKAILYLTEQRHWSIDRAAKIIGLRPDQLVAVPADDGYRMQPAALAEAIQRDLRTGRLPWAVVANAGATNTGAVDPLPALADVCSKHGLWLHVDAAYGWSMALIPEGKALLAGIARADSIVLDPHKWFAQTFSAGCLLIRDGRRLESAFAMRPEYMQDVQPAADEVNFSDLGISLTRRFRALKIWLAVKVLGLGWYRALVEHSCRLAELTERLLARAADFEILSPRQLSVVCFRYRPPIDPLDEEWLDRLNLATIDAVRATGRGFLSSTRLRGRVAMRFCFVNFRTTAADLEEVIGLIRQEGARLASRER